MPLLVHCALCIHICKEDGVMHSKSFNCHHFADGCFIPTQGGNANGARCVFPFYYRGEMYQRCTTIRNDNIFWCATTTFYDVDKQWGNCLGIVLVLFIFIWHFGDASHQWIPAYSIPCIFGPWLWILQCLSQLFFEWVPLSLMHEHTFWGWMDIDVYEEFCTMGDIIGTDRTQDYS